MNEMCAVKHYSSTQVSSKVIVRYVMDDHFQYIKNGNPQAVVRRCSVKKTFLEISQHSQENTCVRVSFPIKFKVEHLAQVFSCEFCEIPKNTFSYRTPPVAGSSIHKVFLSR